MSRILILIYAVLSYVLFIAVSVWTGAFLLDIANIRSNGAHTPWPIAVVIDVSLIATFGIAHSVMARAGFKRVWTTIIPPAAERATYSLQSSLFLMLIFWQWRPIPTTLWLVEGYSAMLIYFAFAIGAIFIVVSTFLLGHTEFVGLQQAWDNLRNNPACNAQFRTPLLYRIVRHPLQLGIVIMLFATPHMTVDHLLFATTMLGYIFIGLRFEERALLREFGETYAAYCRKVPMLIPFSNSRAK